MGTSARRVRRSSRRHIRATTWEDLPAEARKVTARAVMDATGVMMAASGLGEGCSAFVELAQSVRRRHRAEHGDGLRLWHVAGHGRIRQWRDGACDRFRRHP